MCKVLSIPDTYGIAVTTWPAGCRRAGTGFNFQKSRFWGRKKVTWFRDVRWDTYLTAPTLKGSHLQSSFNDCMSAKTARVEVLSSDLSFLYGWFTWPYLLALSLDMICPREKVMTRCDIQRSRARAQAGFPPNILWKEAPVQVTCRRRWHKPHLSNYVHTNGFAGSAVSTLSGLEQFLERFTSAAAQTCWAYDMEAAKLSQKYSLLDIGHDATPNSSGD